MGDTTGISWTDATWNPTRGCSRVSAGCQHCYAEVQAARIVRMGKGKPTAYDGLVKLYQRNPGAEVVATPRWTGEVRLVPEQLTWPLRKKKPLRIFVDSMSDLFHEKLTNEQIAAVFGVMAACPHHTFQCLTKRAKRMREWFEWAVADGIVTRSNGDYYDATYLNHLASKAGLVGNAWHEHCEDTEDTTSRWPLPNVWLGVSVENQDAADERVPELLRTPAAVRFLSCEPLLGPVTLHEDGLDWLTSDHCRGIDWIIAGCESGHGARPCKVEWLRSLRDQCESACVPYFLKQAEESVDLGVDGLLDIGDDDSIAFGDGSKLKQRGPGGCRIVELPYLDGEQHAAFPGVE